MPSLNRPDRSYVYGSENTRADNRCSPLGSTARFVYKLHAAEILSKYREAPSSTLIYSKASDPENNIMKFVGVYGNLRKVLPKRHPLHH